MPSATRSAIRGSATFWAVAALCSGRGAGLQNNARSYDKSTVSKQQANHQTTSRNAILDPNTYPRRSPEHRVRLLCTSVAAGNVVNIAIRARTSTSDTSRGLSHIESARAVISYVGCTRSLLHQAIAHVNHHGRRCEASPFETPDDPHQVHHRAHPLSSGQLTPFSRWEWRSAGPWRQRRRMVPDVEPLLHSALFE